jgi:hypothetical protein
VGVGGWSENYIKANLAQLKLELGLSLAKSTPVGPGGIPEFFLKQNLIFLCELKPHANLHNPTITPSGRKVTKAERRKREGREKRY